MKPIADQLGSKLGPDQAEQERNVNLRTIITDYLSNQVRRGEPFLAAGLPCLNSVPVSMLPFRFKQFDFFLFPFLVES